MAAPKTFDIPHQLGREEARRRIDAGIPKLERHIPGGGTVRAQWLADDRMHMAVTAMGQTIDADLVVEDAVIHVKLAIPAMLAMMAAPISAFIKTSAAKMLAPSSADQHAR